MSSNCVTSDDDACNSMDTPILCIHDDSSKLLASLPWHNSPQLQSIGASPSMLSQTHSTLTVALAMTTTTNDVSIIDETNQYESNQQVLQLVNEMVEKAMKMERKQQYIMNFIH